MYFNNFAEIPFIAISQEVDQVTNFKGFACNIFDLGIMVLNKSIKLTA
jgi:hypothetical protein